LRDKVEKEVERTVKRLGLAKQSEVTELRKELVALRREVTGKGVKVNLKKAPAKKAPAKKVPAKKVPAKKVAKKAAKKSTTKKSSKAGK